MIYVLVLLVVGVNVTSCNYYVSAIAAAPVKKGAACEGASGRGSTLDRVTKAKG